MILDLNTDSPVRRIAARVEFYEGSTLIATYTSGDRIISFAIDRVGELNKFFGFGVCQSINLHLIDKDRELNFSTANSFKCYLTWEDESNGSVEIDAFPIFHITEVHRDENTNEISITAYDKLHAASAHTAAELPEYKIDESTNKAPVIMDVLNDIARMIGVTLSVPELDIYTAITYDSGFNFDGAETFRELLDNIAEVSQTVYHLTPDGTLLFKRFNKDDSPVIYISKDDYYELESKTNRRLSDICSANELGDNVITQSGQIGTTQYVRDNPFWELREDIVDLLNNAIDAVGGLTINQFDCYWRGNPALEIGDKIALMTKDNEWVYSYIIDDVIDYNGSLEQRTRWSYEDNEGESADNPVNLGDALKKTYAKVDKANKEIQIVAGETAQIKVTSDAIQNTVSQLDEDINGVLIDVSTLITADEMSIAINRALEQGIERVTTTTGFTFNEEGLHVSRTGSEMTTSITEDGMVVSREDEAVLVADNQGVKAEDLHATTFLIIGNNSRLEDYDDNRTGCFYIGKI